MRNWVRMSGAAVVLAFAVTAGADDTKDDKKKNGDTDTKFTDAEFVKTAASANLHESKLGEFGQLKATDPRVKEFAKRMVIDHGQSLNELRDAARAANIEVPEKVLPKHEKHVTKFKDHKGQNFDREYMKHMVASHQEALTLYTKASTQAKSDALKAYATKSLPVVKHHHDMAKQISDTLPKQGGDTGSEAGSTKGNKKKDNKERDNKDDK